MLAFQCALKRPYVSMLFGQSGPNTVTASRKSLKINTLFLTRCFARCVLCKRPVTSWRYEQTWILDSMNRKLNTSTKGWLIDIQTNKNKQEKHNTTSSISYLRNCLKLITHEKSIYIDKSSIIKYIHFIRSASAKLQNRSKVYTSQRPWTSWQGNLDGCWWRRYHEPCKNISSRRPSTGTVRFWHIPTHPQKTKVVSCLFSMFRDLYKPMFCKVSVKRDLRFLKLRQQS